MNEVVLWSGGFDSTLILHNLIIEGKDPIALSVNHPNNSILQYETLSRDTLEKKLGKFIRKEYIEGKSTDSDESWTRDVWLKGIFKHMPDNSNAYMGIHNLHDIQRKPVREQFDDFIDDFSEYAKHKGMNVKLQLPLEYMYKEDILEEIWKLGIFDDCWNCEKPQGFFPCGKCVPCERVAKWRKNR